jgi:hypothetical protein
MEIVKLESIEPSNRKHKRFVANFSITTPQGVKSKHIHFGAKEPNTYIDHQDVKRKNSFLARTRNYPSDPLSAANLAKSILWNTVSIDRNIQVYKKKYNL